MQIKGNPGISQNHLQMMLIPYVKELNLGHIPWFKGNSLNSRIKLKFMHFFMENKSIWR